MKNNEPKSDQFGPPHVGKMVLHKIQLIWTGSETTEVIAPSSYHEAFIIQ